MNDNRKKIVLLAILIGLFVPYTKAQVGEDSTRTAIFSRGNRAPADNFTGPVWVKSLVPDDKTFHCIIGSVTFGPGARSHWHSHPAGQILMITGGVCYYQERGKPIQVFHKGDVVTCPPNVEHWHGAAPDSWMTHLSVIPNASKRVVVWLLPVTNTEYNALKN